MNDPVRWLLSFEGRIGRRAFWLGLLVVMIVGAIDQGLSGIVKFAVGLLVLWAFWALVAKRCHDRGKSVWTGLLWLAPHILHWMLIVTPFAGLGALAAGLFGLAAGFGVGSLIAIAWWVVGAVWFVLSLGLSPGEAGPNRFGAPPKD